MKAIIRLAVVASLGLTAFLISSLLMARGTISPATAPAPPQAKEGFRVDPTVEVAAIPAGGTPMRARLGIRDLSVLLDGPTLAISGVGLLDNTDSWPRRLAWSVRIVEPSVNPRDSKVLYEHPYDGQAFALARDASARPTFADVLTLPGPLPPDRYGIELVLVDLDNARNVVARARKHVEVD